MQTSHEGSTGPSFGVTWGGPPRAAVRALTVAAAAAVLAGTATAPALAETPQASTADPVSVIVRELAGAGDRPEKAVTALGGDVVRALDVIDGFEATLPADRVSALRAAHGVREVTENAKLTLSNTEVTGQEGLPGSMRRITHETTGAAAMWDAGYTGAGVDIALIDSGTVPVQGLSTPGKVVKGPDLSFEALSCRRPTKCAPSPVNGMDTYGHGTHLAGIIAGRDAAGQVTSATSGQFVGMAPDSRIVSIKVADALGRTDVSQAIAAIDWVIQHKNADGLNIRVLNLSFGTDGVQSYLLDPLAYAAEQAWHAGIVVVVAAGNEGYGSAKLNNPAHDPYVLAVGGSDGKGTATPDDDVVADWSATGDGNRNPDLVAPGQSVVSLRVPNGYLDAKYPGARTGERFFRGTGTSQATAVVSGAAALLLQQRPELEPDQVKALLTGTARELPATDAVAQGSGLLDLAAAKDATTPAAVQTWQRAAGTGSLDAARGSAVVRHGDQALTGEYDFTGRKWSPQAYAKALRNVVRNGATLEGLSWSGLSWSGLSWSGLSWSGLSWSGLSWSGLSWSGLSWSGLSWSGLSWSGLSWSGLSWSGARWA